MSISVPARAPVRRVRSTGYGNRIGLAVMLAGIFVTVMDNSIVNVAIPSIRSTLGATFAEAELVVASYTFAFAVDLITSGRLGDIFGQRRMFLAGFAAFTLTSALCGFAPSPNMLIVARLLPGASASLLSPQVFSLVRTPETARLGQILAAPGVTVMEDGTDLIRVTGTTAEQIGTAAWRAHLPVYELTPTHASLEEAFMQVTQDSIEYHAGATR